jgi:WD40 repeat protein
LLTFKAHKKPVFGIAFAPDGRLLATSSPDEPVRVWSLAGPTEVRTFPGFYFEPSVAFSPDGRFLARSGDDFAVWGTQTGELVVEGEGGHTIAFSPDSKEVATIAVDDTLRRWALPKVKALNSSWAGSRARNRDKRFPTGALTYSPDSKNLAIAFGIRSGVRYEPHILTFGRNTGKPRLEIVADFKNDHASALAYSPDGTAIAGVYGPVIGVVNAKTGEKLATLKPGKKHFKGVAFTPDGKRLVAVNTDAAVRVYDTLTWTELTGYEWQIGKLTAVAVAPDGLRAACGSDRGRVVVWDLE